jgi:hypothetical protein
VLGLQEWLWRQLNQDYENQLPGLAKASADHQERAILESCIVPILDGLDEIPERLLGKALERFGPELGSRSVIVTCRSKIYESLPGRITRNETVMELCPLELDEAAKYLVGQSRRWAPVFDPLPADDLPAAQALRSPLVVWLAGRVYSQVQTDPAALLDPVSFPTPDAVESHLLTSLVPASFGSAPRSNSGRSPAIASAEEANRWLGFLAYELQARKRYTIAWWALIDLVPWRRLIATTSVLAGVALGLIAQVSVLPPVGVVLALVFGLFLCFGFGRGYSSSREEGQAERGRTGFGGQDVGRDPERTVHLKRLRNGCYAALLISITGLVVGSIFWTLWGTSEKFEYRNIELFTLMFAPCAAASWAFGWVGGKVAGWLLLTNVVPDAQLSAARATSPAQAVHRDGIFGALGTFVCGGAVSGAITAFMMWCTFHANPLIVLAEMIVGGVATSLMFAAWPRYRVAHVWLVARQRIPPRFMDFLAEAHGLGILRQGGIAYEFRHDLLQRALASRRR